MFIDFILFMQGRSKNLIEEQTLKVVIGCLKSCIGLLHRRDRILSHSDAIAVGWKRNIHFGRQITVSVVYRRKFVCHLVELEDSYQQAVLIYAL